jgi:hypothetical protein
MSHEASTSSPEVSRHASRGYHVVSGAFAPGIDDKIFVNDGKIFVIDDENEGSRGVL